MGGYGADLAGLGFVVGALGWFGGTLAHLARGASDDESGGTETPADGGDDGDDAEMQEETADRPVPHRS